MKLMINRLFGTMERFFLESDIENKVCKIQYLE